MEEIWRDVKDYVGLYQVSNIGRIKSMNYNHTGKEGLMKGSENIRGYLRVPLTKDKERKMKSIHSLVWDMFGSSPRNGRILQVDHINGIKTDNRIENLQLLNNRDNISKTYLTKDKSSKYTGVIWHKQAKKWVARIYINGKSIYIGCFNTEKEAAEAYINFKNTLI